MKKRLFLFSVLICAALMASAQILRQKQVDNGGSGNFKAIAFKDAKLDGFTFYRPQNMKKAVKKCGPLPVMIFANGGCSDTNVGYERMLTEVASQGYFVLALGDFQDHFGERPEGKTDSQQLKLGIDWICRQAQDKNSEYYGKIDITHIAAAGHSCGGAIVLANAADSRLSTYLILNAGMGDIQMAGASKESLANLHKPALYVTGGPSDVAYHNAQLDYDRIDNVNVVLADHPASGHGGTYNQQFGGDYARIIIDWLDWQLKGKSQNKDIFINSQLQDYPGWTIKAKNQQCLWINNGNRKIFGLLNRPDNFQGKKPIAIIAHGFNGTHFFGKGYFKTLEELGFMCYTLDFPCGSVNSRSDNNTMEMSVVDEKSDIEAVVRYFKKQPYVDSDNIVLIGESQGGLVSALAASEMTKEISKLVLVYPALCIPDNWNARYPKVEDIPEVTNMWNVPLGKRFFLEVRDIKPFDIIANFKRPVLIVQGDKDPIVPLQDSQRAASIYNDAQIKIIPGAGHGFKPHEFQQMLEFLKDFL